jgi:hypothetical protein
LMKILHFFLHYIWRHCLLLVLHCGDPIFMHQMRHMLILVVFCVLSNMGVGVGLACAIMGKIRLRLQFKFPQVHFCRYVYKYAWRKTLEAKSPDYFKPCLLYCKWSEGIHLCHGALRNGKVYNISSCQFSSKLILICPFTNEKIGGGESLSSANTHAPLEDNKSSKNSGEDPSIGH